ncbi:sigma-54 interaction domain-containing protein [Sphaerotilaceae bacterium SBD11-9]
MLLPVCTLIADRDTPSASAVHARLLASGLVEPAHMAPDDVDSATRPDIAIVLLSPRTMQALPVLVGKLLAAGTNAIMAVAESPLDAQALRTAMALGVVDFMSWPVSADELALRVQRALGAVESVPPRSIANVPKIRGVVSSSPAMHKVLEAVPRLAACDAGVLISGETGTGKEVFAQAIHYLSARASRPWVAVNCGAVPVDLLESELFGHVRGAFTHAHAARAGLVAEAEGGTLFLDDVDCLPLLAQAKLLRFLQEREYRAVGANSVRHADVRVIAASNRNLRALARSGAFREDLYFRLDVLPLALPPLRERREDIASLALHFAARVAQQSHRPAMGLSPAALRQLFDYAWPGNVRELQHVVERAVLLASGTVIVPGDLDLPGVPLAPDVHESLQAAKARCVESFERGFIERLLDEHRGNISHAARGAGKNRRAFFALLQKYGIDAAQFRALR